MVRFRKSMAIAMALVMAGSMACMYPGNASGIQHVYAAEADANVSDDESQTADIEGYNDGDVFTVNVTGVKTPVTYTVTFFTIGELGHAHTFNGAFKSTPDFTNMTAETSAKCDGCGKTFTDSVDITIASSGVSCGYSGSLWYSFRPKFAGKTYSASAMSRVT